MNRHTCLFCCWVHRRSSGAGAKLSFSGVGNHLFPLIRFLSANGSSSVLHGLKVTVMSSVLPHISRAPKLLSAHCCLMAACFAEDQCVHVNGRMFSSSTEFCILARISFPIPLSLELLITSFPLLPLVLSCPALCPAQHFPAPPFLLISVIKTWWATWLWKQWSVWYLQWNVH